MYRLCIAIQTTEGIPEARIRHKRTGLMKVAKLTALKLKVVPKKDRRAVFSWMVKRKMLDLHRDLLYRQFGDNWWEMEVHHWDALSRSRRSAIKRARQVKAR